MLSIKPDRNAEAIRYPSLNSTCFQTNLAKVTKVALFGLALHALSNIPVACAGPFSYSVCISGCELACDQASLIFAPATAGWSFLAILGGPVACPIICSPVLAAPSP